LGLYYYQTKTDNEKKRLLKNEMNKKLCDKNKVQKIAKSSKNDDLQNMRDIADEAINKDPGKPWGYNLRGLIEYYYGERADAEYFLNMSLKVTDDKFAAGYSNLGRLHHKYFEYQRAIKEFEMALEKGEDDLEVLFLLIDSYYEEGLYEKVRARCKELIDQKFTLNYWRKCHEIDLRTGVH
jgi:tetratricopeptide (TPR) repeat protein